MCFDHAARHVGILVPRLGVEPVTSAVEEQNLKPWTQSHRSSRECSASISYKNTCLRVSLLSHPVPPVTWSLQSFCQNLAVLEFFPLLENWHRDRGLPHVAHPLEVLSKTEECKAMLLTQDTISELSEGDSSKPCHTQMGEEWCI